MAEPGVVAYVLKGYPRLSELFIASEIHRLEQAGLELRLYVLRPPDEVVAPFQYRGDVDTVHADARQSGTGGGEVDRLEQGLARDTRGDCAAA